MKRARFLERRIIAVLHERRGAKAAGMARKLGIWKATLHNWKAKYGGIDVTEAEWLNHLTDESKRCSDLIFFAAG